MDCANMYSVARYTTGLPSLIRHNSFSEIWRIDENRLFVGQGVYCVCVCT